MSLTKWVIRTALVWLLLVGMLIATTEATRAVAVRDAQWTPGPLAPLLDVVADAFAWLHLGGAAIALLPAFWWRRRGGSGAATPLIAFAVPLSILPVLELWRGTGGDDLFLTLAAVTIFAMSFVGSVLIAVLVEPAAKGRS